MTCVVPFILLSVVALLAGDVLALCDSLAVVLLQLLQWVSCGYPLLIVYCLYLLALFLVVWSLELDNQNSASPGRLCVPYGGCIYVPWLHLNSTIWLSGRNAARGTMWTELVRVSDGRAGCAVAYHFRVLLLMSLILPRSPGSAKPCQPTTEIQDMCHWLAARFLCTRACSQSASPVTTVLKQCKLIIKCKLWLKSLAELLYMYYKVKPTVLFQSASYVFLVCVFLLFRKDKQQQVSSF